MKSTWMVGLALLVAACTHQEAGIHQTTASPPLPPPNAQGEYTVDWPELGAGEARWITIQLGPDSVESCRDVSPKFAFDSKITYVQDKAQLAAFARCMNKAGMENRKVLLVGRADPRGSDAYNMELGRKRAQQIRIFLIDAGLAANRIQVLSEGAQDAKGQLPEYSYGYDRRVDVIVSTVHAP